MKTVLDIQKRLLSLGYTLPKYGADGLAGDETAAAIKAFQTAVGLPATGKADEAILARLFPAGAPDKGVEMVGLPVKDKVDEATIAKLFPNEEPTSAIVIPASWMPKASMQRIIVHWTAGSHVATGFDKSHYHILIEGSGNVVRGTPTIDLNQSPARKGYAARTLNCNSGSIGVSLCCMAGARESPFAAGTAAMTRAQWDKLPEVLAVLCERYSIDVGPKTVLSHAEVESNLGIKQKGKWDIARLAFDPSIIGAKACGDIFRRRTLELI